MMKKYIWILLISLTLGCLVLMIYTRDSSSNPPIQANNKVNISCVAVGDNLIHSSIYKHNRKSDGTYDFTDMYKNTNQYTQDADLSYINFETICAGKELVLSNYPKFNGPFEVIDGVNSAGFNWLSGCSNHSDDRGEEGILRQLHYVHDNFPEMIMTGLHDSKEDSLQYKTMEIKGIKIGLLSYTYGLNYGTLPTNRSYMVDVIHKDKIAQDMAYLNKITDLQFVSMHWGTEYQLQPNNTQLELAQYLSDLGADVIIGTHPHVIQPMDYLTGKDGNQTLVMYSLGNFISAQAESQTMLGGMVKWNIQYDSKTKEFTFENVQFMPTVTQIALKYKSYHTYALKDWNNELGNQHALRQKGQEISREYFINLVNKVMNDKFEIIY